MKAAAFYESFHDKESALRAFSCTDAVTSAHFHRCIEILYITEGRLEAEVDGAHVTAEKDDIVFVRRCAVHAILPAPSYYDCVLLIKSQFSEDFSSLLEKETLPALLADKQFNRTLFPFFEKLREEIEEMPFLVAKGYIDVIIGSLLSRYERMPVVAAPNLSMVVAALNYIDDHFAEPIGLETLSSVFGYNKYYFSRLFNSYIGENINSYINRVRIENILARARRQEKANLCELAYACGFDSMATFYRNYARYYDKPPTQLLKS